MVVADDEVDMLLIGVRDLIYGFYTAVERDDQGTSFLLGGVDTFGGDTITFGVAVGNIIDEVIRLCAKEGVHQRHGRGTIDIIVTIDHNALVGINGAAEPVYRCAHVAHQERIVQTIQRRTNIRPGFCTGAQSSAG